MQAKSLSLSEHANRRFAWLLEQRGFDYWTEDELDSKIPVMGTRPDFYVETLRSGPFLVEVESFEQRSVFPSVGQFDPEISIKRMRTSVRHAARQLKPYAFLEIPMLVVLDNWRLVGIPSNVGFLRQALFGKLEFRLRLDVDKGILVGEPKLHHGIGQTLHAERKNYISAVAWNMPKQAYLYADPQEGQQMRLRVVHNDFAQRKLPIDLFSDEEDEHHGYDENGRWQRLS